VAVQAQRDIIFELRRIAFDGENDTGGTEKRKAMYTKDYKMLGFTVSLPRAGSFVHASLIRLSEKGSELNSKVFSVAFFACQLSELN
jgi:hypothetical protein